MARRNPMVDVPDVYSIINRAGNPHKANDEE